jgi:hypothetical protein
MARPRITLARLALVAAIALTAPGARGAETLRWSPRPGETLKYTLSQIFDVRSSHAGQEVSRKTEMTVDLTWKVGTIAADGTVEITQTVDHALAKDTATGAVVTYDSNDKKTAEAPLMRDVAKCYEAVLDKPYTIKLSPRGEVVDVKVPEGAAEALAGSPMAPKFDSGTLFSAAGVKNLLAQILPKLPKEPVDKGATWDSDLNIPGGPLILDFKTKYTLSEVSPVATIDAQIVTTMTPTPAAKITIKINKQSGTARFIFDPAAGRLDSATITQSADATIGDGNAEFTQTTDATLTFKLVK